MMSYKKICVFGCAAIMFFIAMPYATSIKTQKQLDITLVKFDNLQEIIDLEGFLFSPEIAKSIFETNEKFKIDELIALSF